jgi:hypothetical protein
VPPAVAAIGGTVDSGVREDITIRPSRCRFHQVISFVISYSEAPEDFRCVRTVTCKKPPKRELTEVRKECHTPSTGSPPCEVQ